jgi:predicted Ser/Thr protein kinase
VPPVQADRGLGAHTLEQALREADLPLPFGRYRIEKIIGQGGMGAVYQAYDTVLGRTVALKVPFLSGPQANLIKARFLREAQAAAALSHPNLCPIHDLGEIDGVPFLTMTFIRGEPLSRRIGPQGMAQVREAVLLVRKAALALQQAHQAGVIHRDLKPSNILVDEQGEPVITDFGLARRQDLVGVLTQDGQALGTPAYMPPEQFTGDVGQMGPASDIYSLGVILYVLMTGKPPFTGDTLALMCQVTSEEPVPPSRHRPGLDFGLDQVCLKALAKKPGDRWPSMQALAQALGSWLDRTAAFAAPPGDSPGAAPADRGPPALVLRVEGSSFAYRPLPGQQVITLGRQKRKPGAPADEGNDMVLRVPGDDTASARVSRRHLEIHRRGQDVYAIDLSKAGTTHNGRLLTRGAPAPLAHGDRLVVAGVLSLEVLLGSSASVRAALPPLQGTRWAHGTAELEVSVGDMVTVE